MLTHFSKKASESLNSRITPLPVLAGRLYPDSYPTKKGERAPEFEDNALAGTMEASRTRC